MELNGLPEGLEAVEYRVPKDLEYYIHGGTVYQSPSTFSQAPNLVVVAKPGHCLIWDEESKKYAVVQDFDKPKTVTYSFELLNEYDGRLIAQVLDDLPIAWTMEGQHRIIHHHRSIVVRR
jgi:hypothetical protein